MQAALQITHCPGAHLCPLGKLLLCQSGSLTVTLQENAEVQPLGNHCLSSRRR